MRLIKRSAGTIAPASTTGFSLVDSAATITGDVETTGSLRIDGRIEGTVRRADIVVLGVGATMTGDIHAREVVIGGTLTGTVHASERVELQATGIVTGDLMTQSVLVQEGGVVNGRVLMQPPHGSGKPGAKPSPVKESETPSATAGAVAGPGRR